MGRADGLTNNTIGSKKNEVNKNFLFSISDTNPREGRQTYGEFIGELIETQWSRLTLRDIESLLADIVQSLTPLTEEKSLEEWQNHENVGFHCPTCAEELEYYDEQRNEGREVPEVGMRCPDCDFKLQFTLRKARPGYWSLLRS